MTLRDQERERAERPPPRAGEPGLPRALLGAALFSLAFSTALFALAWRRLLGFFVLPELLLDLLSTGLVAGAVLGARCFPAAPGSLRKSLRILLAATVLTAAAGLAYKHLDHLRAQLFAVETGKLLGQIAAFTGLLLPWFAACGLAEYVGYRLGRERLRGGVRRVYGLYLLGAAAAHLFLWLALAPLGIAAMVAVALAGIALALTLLDAGWARRAPAAAALLLAVVLPGLLSDAFSVERALLRHYQGSSFRSRKDLAARERAEPRFARWGRYSFLEVLWSPAGGRYLGLHSDLLQWEYAPGPGFGERSLAAVPLWFVPPGGSAAIIGAGGGREVRYAARLGAARILALETEPAVIEAVRGPLAAAFDRVYEAKGVEVRVTEARSYLEAAPERFDLIYLPSAGGSPPMALEPGSMIHTREGYRTLRDRLQPGGILAIGFPAGGGEPRALTDRCVRTLRGLDLEAIAYEAIEAATGRPVEFLILAGRKPEGEPAATFPRALTGLPELKGAGDPAAAFQRLVDGFFVVPQGSGARTAGIPARRGVVPLELPVQLDPLFTPVTDEKPFLAGNLRPLLSLEQVYTLLGAVGGVLCLAGAALAFLLPRRGDPAIPGRSQARIAALSGLIGANFLLAQGFLVLALFRELFVYHDSLVLGAIGSLLLSGLGSMVISGRRLLVIQAIGALSLAGLLGFELGLAESAGIGWNSGAAWVFVLFAPAAFAAGSFFPAVFEAAAQNPLVVFALHALGAALGSLAALLIPIAFGFKALFAVAAAVFAATVVASALFHRGPPPARLASPPGRG